MRKKLVKFLRDIEKDNHYKYEYTAYDEESEIETIITELMDFPNFNFIIKGINEAHTDSKFANNYIKAELKRMEYDGLVMIEVQKIKIAFDGDMGAMNTAEIESVVLTTKGKSNSKYFLHKITENPSAFIAVIISLIALYLSILV